MNKLLPLLLLLLLTACFERTPKDYSVQTSPVAQGDSTLYGLVCDGSTDTIIVYLTDPYDGSDPDTLNILEATRAHRVFGQLRIGDRVAMMRNDSDATVADIVIVTQDLLGQWCYKVKPTLKRRAGMAEEVEAIYQQAADSLRNLLSRELEFGIHIKADSLAMPIGMRNRVFSADEEQLVNYPRPKRYRRWCIRNGQLLLTEMRSDSLGQQRVGATDTATFVSLTPDSLILLFPDGPHHYYRKAEPTE